MEWIALAVVLAQAPPVHQLEGAGLTVTYACTADQDVAVAGAKNTVTLTGACRAVTVSGTGNRVSIEAAASIDVTGLDNAVTWKKGDPKRSTRGINTRLDRVP